MFGKSMQHHHFHGVMVRREMCVFLNIKLLEEGLLIAQVVISVRNPTFVIVIGNTLYSICAQSTWLDRKKMYMYCP